MWGNKLLTETRNDGNASRSEDFVHSTNHGTIRFVYLARRSRDLSIVVMPVVKMVCCERVYPLAEIAHRE